MKCLMLVAALIIFSLALFGCDMRHAVRIELKEGIVAIHQKHAVEDVMATLRPVIDRNKLNCTEKPEQKQLEVKCKTWALSSTAVLILDKSGAARVIVEDESPIFFWTPQPYGRIREEVIYALKSRYGEDHLSCGQGYGLEIPCNEWPQENKSGK